MPTLCTVSIGETITKGDAVCVIGFDNVNNRAIVQRATCDTLSRSKTVFGVAKDDPIDRSVPVLVSGEVAENTVTKLGVGASRLIVTDFTNPVEVDQCKLKRISDTDGNTLPPRSEVYVVGTCDEDGNLIIQPRHTSEETGFPRVFNVCAYGAVSDWSLGRTGTIAAGTNTLTVNHAIDLCIGQKLLIGENINTYEITAIAGTNITLDTNVTVSATNERVVVDNLPYFQAALAAMMDEDGQTKKTVKLVADGHFYLSQTLEITQGVVLEGTGYAYAESHVSSRSSPGTWLIFPKGVTGIRIRSGGNIDNPTKTFNDKPLSGEKTHLRNLTVSCKDPLEAGTANDCREVYDLSVVEVQTIEDLVVVGRHLVIVAQVGAAQKLHIRIFDESGIKVIDKAEDALFQDAHLEYFKGLVTDFRKLSVSPGPLPRDEEDLANYAMKVAGYCISESGCFHGIHATAPVHIENVAVQNFFHNGIHIVGAECGKLVFQKNGQSVLDCVPTVDPDCQPELFQDGTHRRIYDGNADGSYVENCFVAGCGRDGFHFSGGDAQTCVIIRCSATVNRRAGFYDATFGNTYIGCHSEGNNGPSYITRLDVNQSVFIGCWAEGYPSEFKGPVTIISGEIGESSLTRDSSAFILTHGVATRAPFVYKNLVGKTSIGCSLGDMGQTIQGPGQEMIAFQWATFKSAEDHNFEDFTSLRYLDAPGDYRHGWWALAHNNDAYSHMIRFLTRATNARLPAPWFPNGIFIGDDSGPPKVSFIGAKVPPDLQNDNASPRTYEKGDVVWNSEPSTGGLLGWVCIQGGTQGSPNPAQFATFGMVDSPSKAYGENKVLELSDRYVTVTAPGKTMTLPATPLDGQTHAIKSQPGITADVDTADRRAIDGQLTIPLAGGESATFRYSAAIGEWERRC